MQENNEKKEVLDKSFFFTQEILENGLDYEIYIFFMSFCRITSNSVV